MFTLWWLWELWGSSIMTSLTEGISFNIESWSPCSTSPWPLWNCFKSRKKQLILLHKHFLADVIKLCSLSSFYMVWSVMAFVSGVTSVHGFAGWETWSQRSENKTKKDDFKVRNNIFGFMEHLRKHFLYYIAFSKSCSWI